jgi:hypothetical protein
LSSKTGFPDFTLPSWTAETLMERGARVLVSTSVEGAEATVYITPAGKAAFLFTLYIYAKNSSAVTSGYVEVALVSDATRYRILYIPLDPGGLASGLMWGGILRMAPGEQLVILSSSSDIYFYVTAMIIEI